MPNLKKQRTSCKECGSEPYRSFYTYCSNLCQATYQYRQYIEKWKSGKIIGLQSTGVVGRHIKRYLREKFGNKCCICGWSEINPVTKIAPLVADHIDGNWKNNREENLRLLCPNCDALTPTFSGLNRGRGRTNRAASKRAQEARLFLKNSHLNSVGRVRLS
jgi:hypothetical protein